MRYLPGSEQQASLELISKKWVAILKPKLYLR
jgi:hypothetical protein